MCVKEIGMIIYLKIATSIAVSNEIVIFFKILVFQLGYVVLYYKTLRHVLVWSLCLSGEWKGQKSLCVYGGGKNWNSETVCSLELPVMQLINQAQPYVIAAAIKMRRKYENLIIEEVNKILINLETCHLLYGMNFTLKL
jgi:hypothetical protein